LSKTTIKLIFSALAGAGVITAARMIGPVSIRRKLKITNYDQPVLSLRLFAISITHLYVVAQLRAMPVYWRKSYAFPQSA